VELGKRVQEAGFSQPLYLASLVYSERLDKPQHQLRKCWTSFSLLAFLFFLHIAATLREQQWDERREREERKKAKNALELNYSAVFPTSVA